MNYTRFAAHRFSHLEGTPFSAKEYSYLKFGSDIVARSFARTLAAAFFKAHSSTLLSNKCVVTPSPYNYVRNAATVLTKYFVDELMVTMLNTLQFIARLATSTIMDSSLRKSGRL